MYVIKEWSRTFENADTRKRMRLGWFLCPSGTDSAGYIELMSHGERGIKAYAVFLAICQWSATCLPEVRGKVARSSGKPASIRQIAAAIRMPEPVVASAFELLCSDDVGWISIDGECETDEKPREISESASCLPVVCQSSASCLPQGEGKGEGEGKGKGEVLMSAERGRFEEFWNSFPKVRRTKKQEAFRKWKLAVKSVDADLLISRAAEYAVSPKGRSQYAVMPSVWLNSGMWEDDPSAWELHDDAKSTTYKPPSERKRDPVADFEKARAVVIRDGRRDGLSDDEIRRRIDAIRQKQKATA